MELSYSEQDEAFRAELREWLATTLPQLPPLPDRDDWPARRRYDTDWQRRLHDAGYAGLNWPREYGGRDAPPSQQLVFLEELALAKAPYVGVNFVGTLHAGPTLIAEATEEQKRRYLLPILRGEEVWCQGFSEPDAGSDLAALSTRAVRDGDEYVVTGQKIWSSFAQVADFAELLVRTDPDVRKQAGITWLIMPMDAPGIEIRPIDSVLGHSEFSEVFLDEVRVPVVNRVGEENDGWRITQVTFGFERGTAFVSELVDSRRLAEELARIAQQVTRGSATAWDDAALRRDVGHVVAELDALWALTKRNVSEAAESGTPGAGGLVMKLAYSEARQRLGELSLRVLDRAGLALSDDVQPGAAELVEERLRTLALTIAAGTSQIQRNIIGERLLGLPR